MKNLAKKILFFQERLREYTRKTIDYLAKDDIEKAEREYELLYGEPLNNKEKIEIKKNVIVRYSKYLIALLFIIIIIIAI